MIRTIAATAALALSRTMLLAMIAFALAGTGGCASVMYKRTATGKFSGKLYVEWVSPNLFVYRPDPAEPLVFVTSDGRRIQPQKMYTDGGSIPRLFWSVPDFGPWDFGPAYIVHDWLFAQHHCKVDDWASYDFASSARILAEAMKTQMEKGGQPEPFVVYAVHEAVLTPIASRLWNEGKCVTPPLASSAATPVAPAPTVRLLTIDAH